ncbi:MAG: phosphate ABC transporter substrate-binding protein [Proteobacteria bacterium]|nr:phosphate ABC transporter substrate-binding protein [Pseudomonadota bacterium]
MRIHYLLATAFLTAVSSVSWAGDLYVVSGAAVTLTPDEVRQVFLGDKQFSGGTKLSPVENAALQPDFLAKVVKVDASHYNSVWAKKGFRDGLTPPPMRSGDAEVLSAIRANPGTVGYVSKPSDDVKVLEKL